MAKIIATGAQIVDTVMSVDLTLVAPQQPIPAKRRKVSNSQFRDLQHLLGQVIIGDFTVTETDSFDARRKIS